MSKQSTIFLEIVMVGMQSWCLWEWIHNEAAVGFFMIAMFWLLLHLDEIIFLQKQKK
jgi:hypothetical protein